jgi:hypothetical protein
MIRELILQKLEELSVKKMTDYIHKAKVNRERNADYHVSQTFRGKFDDRSADNMYRRKKGIGLANKRIAKKEIATDKKFKGSSNLMALDKKK